MAILSDNDIFKLLGEKKLGITPLEISQIQPASVDLRLGRKGRVLVGGIADLRDFKEEDLKWEEVDLGKKYTLEPNMCLHAATIEKLVVPQNINAKIYGKNSLLSVGLDVNTAYINPGYKGAMPLAIKNISTIPLVLTAGISICQVEFSFLAQNASRAYPEKSRGSELSPDDPVFNLIEASPEKPGYLSKFLKDQIARLS